MNIPPFQVPEYVGDLAMLDYKKTRLNQFLPVVTWSDYPSLEVPYIALVFQIPVEKVLGWYVCGV